MSLYEQVDPVFRKKINLNAHHDFNFNKDIQM